MGRWLATLVVLATALTLAPFAASPASALTPIDSFTPLSMFRYGDHLVDESRGLLYLTGGLGDSRVFVLDSDGQVVHVVTDLPGATDLSLSPDGSRLFVGLSGAAAIAEVDPTTWQEVHRWPVAPAASDVGEIAFVGGSVWFDDGADQAQNVHVLNTVTGGVSRAVTRAYDPALTVDASRGRVIIGDNELRVFDADTRQLVMRRDLDVDATRLVVDGDSLLVPSYNGRLLRLHLADLGLARTYYFGTDSYMPRFAVSASVAAAPDWDGRTVRVVDLETSVTRAEFAFPGEQDPDVLDTAFVAGHLLTVVEGAGWVRVYSAADPTAESADLSFYLPGTPVVGHADVVGVLSDHGVGVGGAVITITGPRGETVEAVTEADGRFRTSVAPPNTGWNAYTATYAGDADHPPAWAQSGEFVDRAPATLVVHGPDQTEPGESFVHTGTLTLNGDPLVGASVQGRSNCADETFQVTTDETGSWSMPEAAPLCPRTDYVFHFAGNSLATSATALRTVTTAWRTSEATLTASPGTAGMDAPVTFEGHVAVDGRPLGGEPVTLTVVDGGEQTVFLRHLTTDEDGSVSTTWLPEVHGQYSARLTFPGSTDTLSATASTWVWVWREPTRVTLTGPSAVPDDGTVVLEGRLVDSGGAPLAGRSIDISRTEYARTDPLTTVTTDDDGRFTATDLAPSKDATVYRASFAGDRLLGEYSTSLRVAGHPQVVRIELDAPDSVTAGEDLSVIGRLVTDDGPLPESAVRLTAVDDSARPTTRVRELTTDADGRFSGTFRAAVAGDWTLEATYEPAFPSDPRASATSSTHVVGLPGVMTLTPRETTVPAGDDVVVDGTLARDDGTPEQTVLSVRRTSPGGARVDLDPVATAADGSFTIRDAPGGPGEWTYQVISRQRLVVTQVEDVSVMVAPPMRTELAVTAVNPDGSDGRYAVYRPAAGPLIRNVTTPGADRCVRFEVQRWRDGAWRAAERTMCTVNTESGVAKHRLAGRHLDGSRWRVRTSVVRTPTATAATSSWTYLRFDRP